MALLCITDLADLEQKFEEAGDKLVVIDFYASWCGPCRMITPKLEELALMLPNTIVILRVDVDDCGEIALNYNITSIPTFVFVRNGDTLEISTGADYDKIQAIVQKLK